ncbi:bifunctional diaminohydroxyphosphoribosylaminopyrimidine deaminase/5-amino-6-(5-phosphoribosylamino)uracil reductase RibD [Phenylobacterium aquaticum]|uniref:bifunctional diaminohydroxyphosphoribosylaminopyrimidine deaminase/5-amino-6-(5-phosphoribosylamino)uracil reductase RibD n=1 Tax=Phenylobacterium aquaticum TaxID=1763816 RepID=UPI0026EECF62|nr:bifunctional diaminohydroxyphosphoribosylaminopyrimidine deaminase/5-amino-6-(5-phosphoribosylamino)uracil reductase RibD [Phenylobacterium aquaticum]
MAATDQDHMRRAIALAQGQVGLTGDNPAVGCVIVAGDAVVGEGVTQAGGRPHAEEMALAQAGDRARGAVAYLTLEPCGARSSGAASCAERLAEAGLRRVVVACEDSSVFAAGQGAERLQGKGVVVELGLLAPEAAALIAAYRPVKG